MKRVGAPAFILAENQLLLDRSWLDRIKVNALIRYALNRRAGLF